MTWFDKVYWIRLPVAIVEFEEFYFFFFYFLKLQYCWFLFMSKVFFGSLAWRNLIFWLATNLEKLPGGDEAKNCRLSVSFSDLVTTRIIARPQLFGAYTFVHFWEDTMVLQRRRQVVRFPLEATKKKLPSGPWRRDRGNERKKHSRMFRVSLSLSRSSLYLAIPPTL